MSFSRRTILGLSGLAVCGAESIVGVASALAREPLPAYPDFTRSSVTWTTKTGSSGRWQIAAVARHRNDSGGWSAPHVLTPEVMAGDVYGSGRLPLDPPYTFRFAASPNHYLVLRSYEDGRSADTTGLATDEFASINISIVDAGQTAGITNADELQQEWPLAARIVYAITDTEYVLDFPIWHISYRSSSTDPSFQVETGPILMPSRLSSTARLGRFTTAHVLFNRPDRIDALFRSSTGVYSIFDRIEPVRIIVLRGARR
jgi:hypothetical protein